MKAKCLSDPRVLYHGDELRVASHTFSLHIHPRQETCEQCEPGCCSYTTSTPADATATNTGQIHMLLLLKVACSV